MSNKNRQLFSEKLESLLGAGATLTQKEFAILQLCKMMLSKPDGKLRVTCTGANNEAIVILTDRCEVEWVNRPLSLDMTDKAIEATLTEDDTKVDSTEMDLLDFAEAMALDISDENIEMALGEDQDEDESDEDDSEEDEEEEMTFSECPALCHNPHCSAPMKGQSSKLVQGEIDEGKGWLCRKCGQFHSKSEDEEASA